MNCPQRNIKFEKTIGIRPSDNNNGLLLYKNEENKPVTIECLTRCSSNTECLNFVLFYNTSSCFWYNKNFHGFEERDTVLDTDVAWFSKICADGKYDNTSFNEIKSTYHCEKSPCIQNSYSNGIIRKKPQSLL